MWVALAILATSTLPSLFDADSGELGNLLPRSSKALTVERESFERFGLPLLSHTLVVGSSERPLTPQQQASAAHYLARVELAFAMAVGLLLDTMIARTLLIPALISIFGRGESEREQRAEQPEPSPS